MQADGFSRIPMVIQETDHNLSQGDYKVITTEQVKNGDVN